MKAEPYGDELGRLDWVVVTCPAHEGEPVEIPAERFQSPTTTFCSDDGFQNKIHQRSDRTVDFFVPDGAVPDAQVMDGELRRVWGRNHYATGQWLLHFRHRQQ